MKVALVMVPTLADVLSIDTPKDLPTCQETIILSKVTTSRGMVDWVWVGTKGGGGCELFGITLSKWAQRRHEAWSL